MQVKPNFKFEKAIINTGKEYIAGIDEAGRGTLAGPVTVGIVIFDINNDNEKILTGIGIDDSKKLSPQTRENLCEYITLNSISYSIGFSTESEIDDIGINNAIQLALSRGLEHLTQKPDHLLIDAIEYLHNDIPQTSIIKGDQKSLSIAAASILAKVTRDNYMISISNKFPHYLFNKNKGYGTKSHIDSIKKYGRSKIHRKSFLIKNVDI
tara:strand:+ start:2446 stop:3075 length:630 start_codon:yes stop_codon:yes gene_type:complete